MECSFFHIIIQISFIPTLTVWQGNTHSCVLLGVHFLWDLIGNSDSATMKISRCRTSLFLDVVLYYQELLQLLSAIIEDLMILWSAYAAQDMVRHMLLMATFKKLPDPTTPPRLWSTNSSSRGFVCYTATALITQCSRFKTSADGHQRRLMCTVWLAPIRQIKSVDTWSSKKRRYSPLD
jgi:hypothetical protein